MAFAVLAAAKIKILENLTHNEIKSSQAWDVVSPYFNIAQPAEDSFPLVRKSNLAAILVEQARADASEFLVPFEADLGTKFSDGAATVTKIELTGVSDPRWFYVTAHAQLSTGERHIWQLKKEWNPVVSYRP